MVWSCRTGPLTILRPTPGVEKRTFPPFLVGRPDRAEIIDGIVARTREILAPYDIGIETDRPVENYMMIVVTGPASENGSVAGNGGDAAVQCGLSAWSNAVSTQYEVDDASALATTQLINLHSFCLSPRARSVMGSSNPASRSTISAPAAPLKERRWWIPTHVPSSPADDRRRRRVRCQAQAASVIAERV